MGIDVTHGTNSEGRPVFRVVGKTNNNETFEMFTAFLPSSQRWVFRALFLEAIPQLLNEDNMLSQLKHITSDQDILCLDAFNGVRTDNPGLYGTAKVRLCKWHLVSGCDILGLLCFSRRSQD